MKQLKRLTCLLLCIALLCSLSACAGGGGTAGNTSAPASGAGEGTDSAPAGDGSASGSGSESAQPVEPTYKVALFAAQGEDQSLPEAGKAFCEAQSLEYVPVTAPSDEKAAAAAVEQAVADGCNVIVLPGQQYAAVLSTCAAKYPDVRFLTLDLSADTIPGNVCCLGVREEEAGFMAGYMAVIYGCTDLAFLGRASEPSDQRYGSGFLQGASCAAMEWGMTDGLSVKYGACETQDEEAAAAAAAKWYQSGTQVVCTTVQLDAVAQAAAQAKAQVIGAGVDESALAAQAERGVLLTGAVTNPAAALVYGLDAATDSAKWASIAGSLQRIGTTNAEDQSKNAAGLSEYSAWSFAFDEDDYALLAEQLADRDLIVSDQSSDTLKLSFKVDFQTIK